MNFEKNYKSLIATSIVVLAVILILLCRVRIPEILGNMKHTCTEPETGTSDISFKGELGDRIKFSFASDIKSGELDMVLSDSKGNEIFRLDRAKELKTYFTLDKSDTYFLTAEYSDFIGKFKITVYEAD